MTKVRRWNRVFWFCLTGTVLLAVGVIFLPRYFSRSLDMRSLNQVEVAARGEFAFVEPSSNDLLENVRAFERLGQENISLVLLASFEQPDKLKDNLIEQVYVQTMTASEEGLIPWINMEVYGFLIEDESVGYWENQLKSARYYSLTYDSGSSSNTREMLNFWYLQYSDGETFDYTFIVNAVTYQIYYAEIYNRFTDVASAYLQKAAENLSGSQQVESTEVTSSTKSAVDVWKLKEMANYIDWWYYLEELFMDGSYIYYQADSVCLLSESNMSIQAELYFGADIIYIEQKILPEIQVGYWGIGIGIENLGTELHKLID